MTQKKILPLSPSQKRDFLALVARRNIAVADVKEMDTRLMLLGRTIIGSAGVDPDELDKAGWDLDLTDAEIGVVLTPPTLPGLVSESPVHDLDKDM